MSENEEEEVGFTRRIIDSITGYFSSPEIEEEQIVAMEDEIVLQDIEKQSYNKKYRPKRNMKAVESGSAPDGDLFANKFARLRSGLTAYYIIDPPKSRHDPEEVKKDLPVILCMHGMTNSSYMYRDVAEILAVAAKCRVVAFDFYGRGRSPWTGSSCTLDLFVTQAKELLNELGIRTIVSCIGFDIGAAVAIGLLAKHYNRMPKIINNLVLISPVGILEDEYEISHASSLKPFIFGELHMVFKYRPHYVEIDNKDNYFNTDRTSYHYPLITKANRIIDFQLASTPGYVGAFISTLRHFPFSRLKELYYVLGQDTSTPMCIITGAEDNILPVLVGEDFDDITSDTFVVSAANNNIHRLDECGHNPVIEKFNEVMEIIVNFYRHEQEFQKHQNIDDKIKMISSGSDSSLASGSNSPGRGLPNLVIPKSNNNSIRSGLGREQSSNTIFTQRSRSPTNRTESRRLGREQSSNTISTQRSRSPTNRTESRRLGREQSSNTIFTQGSRSPTNRTESRRQDLATISDDAYV